MIRPIADHEVQKILRATYTRWRVLRVKEGQMDLTLLTTKLNTAFAFVPALANTQFTEELAQ